jgi:acetylornithine/succinyldiaminopimelate/putrescine aminotransferase
VRETGAYFISRLQELKERYGFIKDVRGRGLMVGLELAVPGAKFVSKCLDRGAIINCAHDTVLRFVPPLIAGNSEIDEMIGILDGVFKEEVL